MAYAYARMYVITLGTLKLFVFEANFVANNDGFIIYRASIYNCWILKIDNSENILVKYR